MRALRETGSSCLLGLLAAVEIAGCASSPSLHAAESGDRAELRAQLVAREKDGTMSNREAASLARAVARRELDEARGVAGLERVRDVEACGAELDGALSSRMDTHDAVGAAAAMVRVEDGALGEASARQWAGDPDEGWRAVGVRGLVRKKDGDDRRRAMLDGSALVRRAAMRAAARAEVEQDEDALFDAARVDPDPYVRTLAVRAMADLPSPHGDEGAALVRRTNRLRDLWTAGDEPLREDVAVAFTMPGVYGAEARDALTVVIAADRGAGAIAAAGAVLRAEARMAPSLVAAAEGLVVRTLSANGKASIRERLHAVAIAPLSREATRRALEQLRDDDDRRVRVAVLARLSEGHDASDEKRDGPLVRALRAMAAMAGGNEPTVAARARAALARLGYRAVQGEAERDLTSANPRTRLAALDDLAALDLAGRGAPLLADDDADVRTRAACALLRPAR